MAGAEAADSLTGHLNSYAPQGSSALTAERRRQKELVAYNDGCAACNTTILGCCTFFLMLLCDPPFLTPLPLPRVRACSSISGCDMEKPMTWASAKTGGARLRQAGTLRMDGRTQGAMDQKTAWRSGDSEAWRLDGGAAVGATKPEVKNDTSWRAGDVSGFSLTGDHSQGMPLPMHERAGGVGRRANPFIMAYNDGSQLSAMSLLKEQRARERHSHEEATLGAGSGVRVEAVPRGFAEARRAALQNKAHAGIVREELWDKRPFALDCSDRSVPNRPGQGGLYPGRHHTDVTAAGTLTAKQMEQGAEERLQQQITDPNKSNWRLGDDLPFTVDFSPARMHENMLSSHQAEWRFGDQMPFRIDGSTAPDDLRAIERAESDANRRRHTDVAYYQHPELADAKRLAGPTAGEEHYGPRAAAMSDIGRGANAGLSWAEMGRRGMLQRSASDVVLMPQRSKGSMFG